MYSDCASTSALNPLNFLEHFPLDFNTYFHTSLEILLMKAPWIWSSWGHSSQNAQIPKAWLLASALCQKMQPYVVWFYALFTKHRRYGARFAKVHITHHIWSVWTPFTFKWPRRQCQSSNALFFVRNCIKLAASALCTFTKLNSYNVNSRGAITMASSS